MHIGTLFLMAQFLTQGCCTRMTVIVYGLVKITGKKKENKKRHGMQGTLRVCKIGYTSTCHITCYSFLSNIAFARTTSFKSISSSTLQHSVYIHAALPQFLQCILIST